MTTDSERFAKASAAGKRAGGSPYEKRAKVSTGTKVWVSAVYVFDVAVALWLGRHGAPWWMTVGFWALITVGALMSMIFRPLMNKYHRRYMLMAREQVHRVRGIDPNDPVGLGLGHLFNADPGLDRLSAESGARFALSAVNTMLDEVEAETPIPTFLGQEIDPDKKAKRR